MLYTLLNKLFKRNTMEENVLLVNNTRNDQHWRAWKISVSRAKKLDYLISINEHYGLIVNVVNDSYGIALIENEGQDNLYEDTNAGQVRVVFDLTNITRSRLGRQIAKKYEYFSFNGSSNPCKYDTY